MFLRSGKRKEKGQAQSTPNLIPVLPAGHLPPRPPQPTSLLRPPPTLLRRAAGTSSFQARLRSLLFPGAPPVPPPPGAPPAPPPPGTPWPRLLPAHRHPAFFRCEADAPTSSWRAIEPASFRREAGPGHQQRRLRVLLPLLQPQRRPPFPLLPRRPVRRLPRPLRRLSSSTVAAALVPDRCGGCPIAPCEFHNKCPHPPRGIRHQRSHVHHLPCHELQPPVRCVLPAAAPAMKGFTMSLTSTRGPLPTEKLRQKAIFRYSQHEADALASPSPLTSRRDQPSTDQQGTSRPPCCRRSRTGITSHVLLLQVTRLPDLHGVPMAAFNAYNSPSIVPSCCLCLCLMINVPGRRLRGLWIGRHWVEIRKIDGIWFN